MAEELQVSVKLTNEKIQFTGEARSNPSIICDYNPPIGDGEGYTGLELLLMSLAACSGSSVVFLLRKMKKTVTAFSVHASGARRDRHPTSFERIVLDFTLHSPDADESDLRKAVELSEETYCPVWAMLKNNVEVTSQFSVIK